MQQLAISEKSVLLRKYDGLTSNETTNKTKKKAAVKKYKVESKKEKANKFDYNFNILKSYLLLNCNGEKENELF